MANLQQAHGKWESSFKQYGYMLSFKQHFKIFECNPHACLPATDFATMKVDLTAAMLFMLCNRHTISISQNKFHTTDWAYHI